MSLAKLDKKQKETKAKSGRKAPRRFDYKPATKASEVGDEDLHKKIEKPSSTFLMDECSCSPCSKSWGYKCHICPPCTNKNIKIKCRERICLNKV